MEPVLLCTGTKFTIQYSYDNDNNEHDVQLIWHNKGNLPIHGFDNSILEYLADRLFNSRDGGRVDDDYVHGFATLKFSDDRVFNAHPYARNERPRHDWVLIRWSEIDNPVPARLEMFLDLRTSTLKFDNMHVIHPDELEEGTNTIPFIHSNKTLTNSVYAIIRSARSGKCPANHLTKDHLPTSLCYRIQLEGYYRLIEVTSFEQKCFAYMNTVGCDNIYDQTAVVFHHTNDWPQLFLDGCPHSA